MENNGSSRPAVRMEVKSLVIRHIKLEMEIVLNVNGY